MRRISVGSEGRRRESNGSKDTAPAAGDGGPPVWWSPELILYWQCKHTAILFVGIDELFLKATTRESETVRSHCETTVE